jgi:carbamoyl-phosphate synthase large subunit
MLGDDTHGEYRTLDLDHVAVKTPQFSFARLKGADPVLYVEMTSTGEAACLGDSLEEAWRDAARSVGFRFPTKRILLSIGGLENKRKFLDSARSLVEGGFELWATGGTHRFLAEHGVASSLVHKVSEGQGPTVVDLIRDRAVECVINVPTREADVATLTDGYAIRRTAADLGVALVNDAEIARLLVRTLFLPIRDEALPLGAYARRRRSVASN